MKATQRIWRTAEDGRYVGDGHPDAVSLAYAPGDEVPNDLAVDESTAAEREASELEVLRVELDAERERSAALEKANEALTAELEQAGAVLAERDAQLAKAAETPADKAAAKPADKAAARPATK